VILETGLLEMVLPTVLLEMVLPTVVVEITLLKTVRQICKRQLLQPTRLTNELGVHLDRVENTTTGC
jgi:hypothetical protein